MTALNPYPPHGGPRNAMGASETIRGKVASGWSGVAGVGGACALVPAVLLLSDAFQVQVIAAAAGALLTTGGFGLGRAAWPGWRRSDLRRLLLSLGFFLGCAGAILMLAGVGLYH